MSTPRRLVRIWRGKEEEREWEGRTTVGSYSTVQEKEVLWRYEREPGGSTLGLLRQGRRRSKRLLMPLPISRR